MNMKKFDWDKFSHELLLTTRQKKKLRNAFENNMAAGIKLFIMQISKIIQSVGFSGTSLSKIADSLMKVAVPLAKNILAPWKITAAAPAIDAGIEKKTHGSEMTTLIILNEKMSHIMKIVQGLEDCY